MYALLKTNGSFLFKAFKVSKKNFLLHKESWTDMLLYYYYEDI